MLKVWSTRHRDLAQLRNQVACRLHAVLCDLVPGGLPKEISAAQADAGGPWIDTLAAHSYRQHVRRPTPPPAGEDRS